MRVLLALALAAGPLAARADCTTGAPAVSVTVGGTAADVTLTKVRNICAQARRSSMAIAWQNSLPGTSLSSRGKGERAWMCLRDVCACACVRGVQ